MILARQDKRIGIEPQAGACDIREQSLTLISTKKIHEKSFYGRLTWERKEKTAITTRRNPKIWEKVGWE